MSFVPYLRVLQTGLFALMVGVLRPGHAFAAPQIFWMSDPAGPGDTVMIIGQGLAPVTGLAVQEMDTQMTRPDRSARRDRRDEHGRQGTRDKQSGAWQSLAVAQSDDQAVKFTLPAAARMRPYRLSLRTSGGEITRTVNTPTIYWIQGDEGDEVTAGGWLRIFGRCIAIDRKPVLRMVDERGGTVTVTATVADLWSASFRIPAGLRTGRYRVVLVAGGVETPIENGLWVATADDRPSRPVIDVARHGAQPDGSADALPAFQQAIQAAGTGPATVRIPAGSYRLSGMLDVPPGIELVGEREGQVQLFWNDVDEPPAMLVRLASDTALRNLQLFAVRYRTFIGTAPEKGGGRHRNIALRDVVVRGNPFMGRLSAEEVDKRARALGGSSGDALRLTGENLKLTRVDVLSAQRTLVLDGARHVVVTDSVFRNGRWGWYSLSGVDRVIFERNQVVGADLMASGGGINTLGGGYAAQNVFVGGNRFEMLQGWDREALTSDGGTGLFYGAVRATDARRLTLTRWIEGDAANRANWPGAGVFILGGRGRGQYAQVLERRDETVTLDRDWLVAPDETSVLTIVPMQQNFLIVGNEFVDTGVAVQFYGTSLNHVVAGNRSRRSSGFTTSGRWYRHFQPSWYCQFLGNTLEESRFFRGGANGAIESGTAFIGIFGFQKEPNQAALTLGQVVRGNDLAEGGKIVVSGATAPHSAIRDLVVEKNRLPSVPGALQIDPGNYGLVLRDNDRR